MLQETFFPPCQGGGGRGFSPIVGEKKKRGPSTGAFRAEQIEIYYGKKKKRGRELTLYSSLKEEGNDTPQKKKKKKKGTGPPPNSFPILKKKRGANY